MKRYIIVLFTIFVCSLGATNYQFFGGQGFGNTSVSDSPSGFGFQVNLGLDMAGNHAMEFEISDDEYDDEGSIDLDVKTGITPSIEFLKRGQGFGFGVGAGYQMKRDVVFEDNYNDLFKAGVGFIPLYGIVKYNYPFQNGMAIEPTLQLGYNLFTYDDDYAEDYDEDDYYSHVESSGGICYGIGLNLLIQDKYVVRLFSKANRASLKIEEGEWYGSSYSGYWETYEYEIGVVHSQVELGVGYRF